MKIVILSYYNGVVYRGVETFVHELSNRLIKKGHDILICQNGLAYKNSLYKVFTTKISTKYYSGGLGTIINMVIDNFRMADFTLRALRNMGTGVDVVIATNNGTQAFLSRIWTFWKGIKLVLPGQAGAGLTERLSLYCFPEAFVPISEYQLKWARRINPYVKSVKIHNGVDLNKFGKSVKGIKLKLKRPVILDAAALWPWMKRQQLLIKAVAKLEDTSLLLVGDGEGKAFLQNLGDKLLKDRFQVLSFPYHEMPSVYASADIFSFPTSSWESFGIVMVEAMASGLPVVANDDPIRREIVGDAGIYVNPKDTEAYAKALKEALTRNWGDRPRKQAEKFSWDKTAQKYEKLLLELVK